MKPQDSDRLMGKFEEFHDWAKEEFKKIDSNFDLLREEVEEINKARWILYGKTAVMYSIIVIIVEFIVHKTVLGPGA